MVVRDLATKLVREGVFSRPDDVLAALRALRERGLLAWELEVPLGWEPEHELATLLARIEEDALRARATQPLDELGRARARIASAAGDPDGLDAALASLDEAFTSITGKPPTRAAGAMYASR